MPTQKNTLIHIFHSKFDLNATTNKYALGVISTLTRQPTAHTSWYCSKGTERLRHGVDVWRMSFCRYLLIRYNLLEIKYVSRDEMFMCSQECYFWCLIPKLHHKSWNKEQNNPFCEHLNTSPLEFISYSIFIKYHVSMHRKEHPYWYIWPGVVSWQSAVIDACNNAINH